MKRKRTRFLKNISALSLITLLFCSTDVSAQRIKTASGPEADFRYGQILYDNGHFHAAIDIFKRFQENNPEGVRSQQSQYRIGEAYLALEDYERAFKAFQKYTAVYPYGDQYGDAWFQQAECHVKMGNLEKAADLFSASAKSLFDNEDYAARGLYRGAEIYLRLGEHQKAYKALHDLADNYPENSYYYSSLIQLAKIYAGNGELLKAVRELDRIRRSNADDSSKQMALFLKGTYQFRLRQYSSAEESLNSVISNTDKSSFIYHDAVLWLTRYYISHQRYSDAETLLNDLLGVTGIPIEIKGKAGMLLGNSRYFENNYEEAESALAAAAIELEGDPARYRVLYFLGKTQKTAGKEEEAFNTLRELFSGDRFFSPEQRIIEDFEADAFRVFLSTVHTAEVPVDITLYTENIVRASDSFHSADLFVDWAEVLKENGMFREAAVILGKGLDRIGNAESEERFYLELGSVYETMDNAIDAVHSYNRIIEHYPGGEAADEAEKRKDYLIRKFPVTPAIEILNEQVMINNILLRSGGRDPDPPDALSVGEFYYLVMRDYDQAARYLQIAMRDADTGPNHMKAVMLSANMAYDLYKIAVIEDNHSVIRSASERALTLYNELIGRYPDGDSNLSALKRIMEITSGQVSGDLQRLNTGLLTLTQIATEPNSLIGEYKGFMLDKLIVLYSSEEDSVEAAFRRIRGMSIDRFSDDLLEEIYYDMTKAAYRMKDFNSAVSFANRYMISFPRGRKSPEVRYIGAVSLYHTGDKIASREWINDLQGRFLYSNYADLGRILEGDILNWAGQYEEALDVYRSEIIRQADHFSDDDVLASLYWKTGQAEGNNYNYKNAADYYRLFIDIVEEASEKVKGYYSLANALIEVEKHQEGLAELEKVIQLGEDSPYYLEAKMKEAELLIRMENYETAQVKYKELSQMQLPDTSLIKFEFRYLYCLYNQDLRQQANREKGDFERRFRNLPDEIQDYYTGLLKVEEGRVHYRWSHESPNRFKQADDLFRDVIKDYPGTRQAQWAELWLGLSLLRQNEYEEGLPLLSQFDIRNPDSPYLYEVYKYLGVIQYTREQYSDAFLALNKAINTAEGLRDSTVHKRYIDASSGSGFDEVTISAIRTYLKHFPDAPDRVRQLERIGIIYRSQGRYEEAIALYRDLLKEADQIEELDIQMGIADSYNDQGKYSIAIAEYLKIISYGEVDHPAAGAQIYNTMRYNVALCYEKIGQYDQAMKFLDEIIRREGGNTGFTRQAVIVKDRINRIKRDLEKNEEKR